VSVEEQFQADIAAIRKIPAVIRFRVVCEAAGMGFAAVARVTEDRWIACKVLDNVHFNLEAGGELKVETTLCNEVRDLSKEIVIDNVGLIAEVALCCCPRCAHESRMDLELSRTDAPKSRNHRPRFTAPVQVYIDNA